MNEDTRTVERRIIRSCIRRVIVLLGLAAFMQGIDRLNIAYAALQMNSDLGFSAGVFGFGAGIFFLTYFAFGVPSNLWLVRFGARRWLTITMIAWGSATLLIAFVHDATSFYAARLLLGAAEAGFAPTMIYLTGEWIPSSHRGRVLAMLSAVSPMTAILGAPVAAGLLRLTGFGLRGWQWLFLVEGSVTIVLAMAVLKWMRDRPSDAEWLSTSDRCWLEQRLAADRPATTGEGFKWAALLSPRVLALGVTLFGGASVGFSVMFFLPQIVKQFGLSDTASILASALPPAVGVTTMLLWGRHSDRTGERAWHAMAGLVTAVLGALIVTASADSEVRLLGLCIMLAGAYAFLPCFWTFPTTFLSGASAAAGIALIHSVGNLAGFFGPTIMGAAKDLTGSFDSGLRAAAGFAGLSIVTLLWFRRSSHPSRVLNPARAPELPE